MRHNVGMSEAEDRELSDHEAAHEAMRRREWEMTPQQRLRDLDSFCYDLTRLAAAAQAQRD